MMAKSRSTRSGNRHTPDRPEVRPVVHAQSTPVDCGPGGHGLRPGMRWWRALPVLTGGRARRGRAPVRASGPRPLTRLTVASLAGHLLFELVAGVGMPLA